VGPLPVISAMKKESSSRALGLAFPSCQRKRLSCWCWERSMSLSVWVDRVSGGAKLVMKRVKEKP
jgi:hypothetical protein